MKSCSAAPKAEAVTGGWWQCGAANDRLTQDVAEMRREIERLAKDVAAARGW